MKNKEIEAYMEFAQTVSKMSYATRLKVGAVIAKEGGDIVSYGYNGTPSGYDNNCEYKVAKKVTPIEVSVMGYNEYDTSYMVGEFELKTRPEVIHAELNCIIKAARAGKSCEGAWLFLTHMPCDGCVKHIVQSGIKMIVYKDVYASASHGNSNGKKMLEKAKIQLIQWNGSMTSSILQD